MYVLINVTNLSDTLNISHYEYYFLFDDPVENFLGKN